MRKILLLLLILFIYSCEKGIDNQTSQGDYLETNSKKQEDIFKETGCKPTDCNSISKLKLFTDEQKIKYLYGSKIKDNKECFWVAQFDAEGNQCWEIINKGELPTYAHNPQKINNGNIVVANVSCINVLSPSEISPVLINPKNGNFKVINIKDHYGYSDIIVSESFFICYMDEEELSLIPTMTEWYAQISNDGEVIYQNAHMNIPSDKFLFIDDNTFINMSHKKITRENLKQSEPIEWEYPVSIPQNTKCDMELSLDKDDISAIYNITLVNGEQQTVKYKISYTTGKNPVRITGITLPQKQGVVVGENICITPFITPEDASVTSIVWQSSDESVATIDNTGKIKGIKKGTCTITATTVDGDYKATCSIYVTLPTEVNNVHLDTDKLKLLLNTGKKLTATIAPQTAINTNMHWSSSNDNIASVDQFGYITAKAIGNATISVTTEEGGYSSTCEVTVVDITNFISLSFASVSAVIINGYVTGGLYSEITNNSEVAITITRMDIMDGFGSSLGDGANLLPKTIAAGESYNLGSNSFKYAFCPIFTWYIEYDGKTYSVYHQYGRSYTSVHKTTKVEKQTNFINVKHK